MSEDVDSAESVAQAILLRDWPQPYWYVDVPKEGLNKQEQIADEIGRVSHIIFILSKHCEPEHGRDESLFYYEFKKACERTTSFHAQRRFVHFITPGDTEYQIPGHWLAPLSQPMDNLSTASPVSRVDKVLDVIEEDHRLWKGGKSDLGATAMPVLPAEYEEELATALSKVSYALTSPKQQLIDAALVLFDRREPNDIPDVRCGSGEDYEESMSRVVEVLDGRNPRGKTFRPDCIRATVELSGNGDRLICAKSRTHLLPQPLKSAAAELAKELAQADANATRSLIKSTYDYQVQSCSAATSVFYVPLRLVEDDRNRDCVGFLLLDIACISPSTAVENTSAVRDAVKACLTPILRQLSVERLEGVLRRARGRREIQESCLDTALGLSGADWACIKSRCVGPVHVLNSRLVAAECVSQCPRFYSEGVFSEGERKIDDAINQKEDTLIVELGTPEHPHPARGAFLAMIRDETAADLTRHEPRNPNSDICGVLVLQHTHLQYLKEWERAFTDDIRRVCELYADSITKLAQEEMVRSTEWIRKDDQADSIQSLEAVTGQMVSQSYPNCMVDWLLVDLGKDPSKWSPATLASSASLTGRATSYLESIVGVGRDLSADYSLLYAACNARQSLAVFDITSHMQNALYKAIQSHLHRDSYQACFRGCDSRDGEVLIDLGAYPSDQELHVTRFSLAVLPIVFTNGLPVGAVVVCFLDKKILGDREWKAAEDHETQRRLARVLYERRHDVSTAQKIRGV
ncbi:MAG: hypothetical protein AAGI88_19530 [Pseudomonadota bacterium]